MKTVFVVDDSNTSLVTAKETLAPYYDVFTLSSAAILFEFLEHITPDLILLDVMMPDINGFDAMARLRADARHADIPVAFLTGTRDAETEARGLELGAAGFISKPFLRPILLGWVQTHLAVRED